MLPYFLVMVVLIIIANAFILVRRNKKTRYMRKDAEAERKKLELQHDNLVRKLDREQEEAAKRVELRNKTFDMYEQVRKNAEFEIADENTQEDKTKEDADNKE